MNTTAKIIVGFLIGTALGTATGLLMAPAAGTRTRKDLNKKAKKLVKQIEGIVTTETKKRTATSGHIKNGKAPVAL
jgi:gas vesicle protein